MNNTTTEIKTTLEGINSTITEAKEWISKLEDRMVKIMQQNKEMRTVLEISGRTLNARTFTLQESQKRTERGKA